MDINAKKSLRASQQCQPSPVTPRRPSLRQQPRLLQISLGCLALLGGIGSAQAALPSLVTEPALLSGENPLARISYHKGHSGRPYALSHKHIVPVTASDGLILNLPERMLYVFHDGRLSAAYPVAVGKADTQTPLGNFRIVNHQMNHTWHVPKSIQEEMRNEGKVVKTSVPPGPKNPLGKYWMGTSMAGIGIHGTIAPSSIYHFASHGCIRLNPHDIKAVFAQSHVGEHGKIIYQPVMLARTPDGHIFAEVNPDPYSKGPVDPLQYLESQAAANHLTSAINWDAVKKVVARHDGVAHDVGKSTADSFYAYESHHTTKVKGRRETGRASVASRMPEAVAEGMDNSGFGYPDVYGPEPVGESTNSAPMPVIVWPHP